MNRVTRLHALCIIAGFLISCGVAAIAQQAYGTGNASGLTPTQMLTAAGVTQAPPLYARALIRGAAGGCPLTLNLNATACVRSSTGVYLITLTGFTAQPICTATLYTTGTTNDVSVVPTSSVAATVYVETALGAAADGSVQLFCIQ